MQRASVLASRDSGETYSFTGLLAAQFAARAGCLGSGFPVLDARQAGKVLVLRPQRGVLRLCSRQNQAVGHGKAVFEADQGPAERNGFRHFNHSALLHLCDGLQSLRFVGDGVDLLENLVEADHRNE